jgi:predicted acetyltransferase
MTARRPDQRSTIAHGRRRIRRAGAERSCQALAVDLELRTVRDDELGAFLGAVSTGFGMVAPDEHDEYSVHLLPAERCLAVHDDGAVVGTAGAFPFRLTVPGGAQVAVAAVTVVTVHPTHRRRGLLRQMMDEQLDDVARRGEPLAVLTASEASIYERFGYGTATFTTRWELESEYASVQVPGAADTTVRLVEGDAALKAARAVYDAAAASRVGEIERPPDWWSPIFGTGTRARRFFTAVHEGHGGRPDAFARYALDRNWPDGVPADTLRVIEIQGVDPEAEAAMWAYLFGIDLVGTVRAENRPVDDPLRWRLPDARRLRVRELHDHLWVRVVDVAGALAARTYGADDALVLELVDEFRPDNNGRWLIDGGPEGAVCTRTDRAADFALGTPDLGAIYLGGVPPSTLAAAGRVRELTTGAVQRADRYFVVQPAPWCTTHF